MATQTGSIDLKAAKNAHDEAEKVATNYVSDISNGILVHPENDQQNGVKITNKVDILRSNVSVMAIGETNTTTGNDVVRIGKSGETRAEIDYHSLQLVSKEGTSYFHVSDLRDQSGYATISEEYIGDGVQTYFTTAHIIASVLSVKENGHDVSYTYGNMNVTLTSPPGVGSTLVITYTTSDVTTKALTFGYRKSGSSVGGHSVAAGIEVTASGSGSHAEGLQTTASGGCAHAEGAKTIASGTDAHAEGYNTKATGSWAHSEGYNTKASNNSSHAEGNSTTASGDRSHAEGNSTTASGGYTHAEGNSTTASGNSAHAEGNSTTASGVRSHAEGWSTTASNDSSHAEGYRTIASGKYSHAEGTEGTEASGESSHAEGWSVTASGDFSHAEGAYTTASGDYSHSQNYRTIAQRKYQTALGEFNVADTTGADGAAKGDYVVIVGNGTSDNARSNALTVAWTGDVVASGDITDGSGNVLSDKADTSIVPTMSAILDMFYPVGSYYETSDSTFDPNNAWGGTWYQEIEGQVHVSAGSNYTVSGADTTSTVGSETRVGTNRGGEATVTLTANQSGVPQHTHPISAHSHGISAHSHGISAHSHAHTLKLPSHAHNAANDYYVTTNSTSIGRRTIKNGTGTQYTNNVYSESALVRSQQSGDIVSEKSITGSISNNTAALSTNNNTTALSTNNNTTALSTNNNTAADATSAHENMQPYINVYRWHRVA